MYLRLWSHDRVQESTRARGGRRRCFGDRDVFDLDIALLSGAVAHKAECIRAFVLARDRSVEHVERLSRRNVRIARHVDALGRVIDGPLAEANGGRQTQSALARISSPNVGHFRFSLCAASSALSSPVDESERDKESEI